MSRYTKRLALLLAGACAFALPTTAASASAVITAGDVFPIPSSNDFQSQLAGLGFFNYTSTNATLTLTTDSMLTFELLGSESFYNDTFTAGGVTYTETTPFENDFLAPIMLGSNAFSAGSLAGILNFTSNLGLPATVGEYGFGIFLPGREGYDTNVFYLGYDDFGAGPDDNHDDFVVRVTVASIPEPATWAMMLLGFCAIGVAVRRRRRTPALAQIA